MRSSNTKVPYCHVKGIGYERMGNSYKEIKQLSSLLTLWATKSPIIPMG